MSKKLTFLFKLLASILMTLTLLFFAMPFMIVTKTIDGFPYKSTVVGYVAAFDFSRNSIPSSGSNLMLFISFILIFVLAVYLVVITCIYGYEVFKLKKRKILSQEFSSFEVNLLLLIISFNSIITLIFFNQTMGYEIGVEVTPQYGLILCCVFPFLAGILNFVPNIANIIISKQKKKK